MISAEQRDDCLDYLAMTDAPYAKAKAYMIGIEDQKSTVTAMGFLKSNLKTDSAKKADSVTGPAYRDWRDSHREAVYDYEIMRNKRSTAALTIELWRSEFSARKAGVIL